MRKALVVGINYYQHGPALHGCVNDAYAVQAALSKHSDGTPNFDVMLLAGIGPTESLYKSVLKDSVSDLFKDDDDVTLFYFAGHGHISSTGGYILASDSRRGDDGIPLGEIVALANKSKAKNRIIVLDSCHSGIAGIAPNTDNIAEIAEGVTILTASTADQYASEENGHGVFTALFVDALSSASNLVGDVTPGSVYSHIDQSLGAWAQRPVFKTNVKSFVSLRKVQPPIPIEELRRIIEFFPTPGYTFQLNPSFEPEIKGRSKGMPKPDPINTSTFAILQKYNRVNLLVPVNAPHMWHAAMESRSCKLTVLGEHYRKLVELNRI